MKDQKELEQLKAEYIKAKMDSMKDDGDGNEMVFYAERGLEDECKDLTFKEVEDLIQDLADFEGDDEDENED